MPGLDLTSRDLDDLLQLLFDRLRGKKAGLALAEPAVILLEAARERGHGAYRIHIPQYEPIILDTFISGISDTFGYDAQKALASLCAEMPSLSSGYLPETVARGLERLRADLGAVDTVLAGGDAPGDAAPPAAAPGFFHELAAGSVNLPLVSNFTTAGGIFTTARLIQPRVELRVTGEWSMRRRHAPAVTFIHMFADPDGPFERQIHTALRLAERLSASRYGAGALPRLPRQYRVSLPEIAALPASSAGKMSGGSAGLAFAVLFAELIGKLELGRGIEIAAGTVFTGGVTDTGEVLPVEDSFIAPKVRAAFYSTCRRFVVPERNLPTAESALSMLRREHPRRELELIPSRTIGEVLSDGRTARLRRAAPARASLQRIFHWRKHLIACVSTLVAAAVSIFVLPAYLDRQVYSIAIADDQIVMKNRAAHLISKHPLGYGVSTENTKSAYRLLIRDIDSQPGEEAVALVVEKRLKDLGHADLLHLYLFSKHGELIRETAFSEIGMVKGVIDPSKLSLGHFLLGFESLDGDSDGYDEIFCLAHHGNSPPSSLIRFSLRDTTTAIFIHDGLLRSMKPIDIDNDEREELLLTGYNPTLDRAVAIIMDPRFVDGASPRHARIEIPGHDRDVARYYIQFPESRLLERFKHYRELKLNCEIFNSGQLFSIIVKGIHHQIRFDFDETLAPTGAFLYRIREGVARKDVRNEDWIEDEQSQYADHLAELMRSIRYWDGEQWRDHPVENRSYVRLKSEALASGTESVSR